MRRGLPVAVIAVLLAACGGGGRDEPCCAVPIEVAIASAPHVLSVQEQAAPPPGYRLFWLEVEQPADHAAPGGPAFRQFASLLWRGSGRPVVLATNGYGASRRPGPSEIAALLDASQLAVEHRFFGPSTPSPVDWSLLTIQQAAADHHRVVESLKPVLGGKWISAGASKGGMTAVYHRRFYPADVDGTVAYVAPISTSTSDAAYVAFLQAVGTAECRQALESVQHALLARRAEVQPLFEASAGPGDGFTTFGPARAFDYAVVELSFAFWQYGSGLPACAAVPAPDAAPEALFAFMDGT
ncbi:MAG TPA: S28 family serine protease, partial [Anaeromyxobacteraceae bacterium]|nr:S28 family serine protease [Anaeromyxobacteraceae bacterium]